MGAGGGSTLPDGLRSHRLAGPGSGGTGADAARPRGRGSQEEGVFTEHLFLCCAECVRPPAQLLQTPPGPRGPATSRPAPRCRGHLREGQLGACPPPRGSASPPMVLTRKQWHPSRSLLCTDSSAARASVSVPGVVMAVHFLP